MKTRITIVCENSVNVPFPLIGEHGLSMLIERDGVSLFDTGQGLGLLHNVSVLGKNPAAVDRVILSHGHYDHTGGLLAFAQGRDAALPVFVNPDAFIPKFAVYGAANAQSALPIGFPRERGEYERAGCDFHHTTGHEAIEDGMHALSAIPRPEGWRGFDAMLKRKEGDAYVDDPFTDDLSLCVETDSGPVVLLGCAHAGIVEILDAISRETGFASFHAVIGGTHLGSAPVEYVYRTIDALQRYRVRRVGVSHCTGSRAALMIASAFPEAFTPASVGAVFEF